MSGADDQAAAMVDRIDTGRCQAFYTELQASQDPAALAAAITLRLDPLIQEAADDVEAHRRLLEEAEQRLQLLEQLAGAARAIALGEPPEDSVLLRGRRIAEAAIEVARDHGRTELHYREWFDLVRRAGHLIGGADPQASFLTALHRHPGIESVGGRTGLWRVPEEPAE